MQLLLVPLIGPFHLRSPAYNAVSVCDLLALWQPDELATSALVEGELADPKWQDTPEIALPLAVVPWAQRERLRLREVGEANPEPGSEEDFRRYLEPYPELRQRLQRLDALEEQVRSALDEPLSAETVDSVLLPALARHQAAREAEFEDGPASGWLRQRMGRAAERLLQAPARRLAVLAPVEHLPFLRAALSSAGVTPDPPPSPPVTPAARERSLLDYAFRTEVPEPGRVIERLREVAGAEARYHEANLLLAGGHGYEALELLERTSRGDFSSPFFLPGYLLARLGQLRDLAGQRGAAARAYRGVLALDYAPADARQAAQAGLAEPFSP